MRGGMVPLRHYGAAMKTTGNSNWRIASVALLCAAALSASAITQEEWEADPTLIPTPSATSEFYVTGTAPTDSTGEQSVSAEMTGLDRKVVDKTMAAMKKDGSIVSPVRCKWEPAKK